MISSSIRWLLAQQPSISTPNPALDRNNADDGGTEECSPFKLHGNNAFNLACQYVQNNSDTCEGGGYLTWTRYTICEENDVTKTLIIIASVIVLLILFLCLSISADDFFCRNISAIVDHLKIPQHIAGVTFMAFGNGAPDVFTSLASALSTNQPKAGLSIGELLGAGIFVTTMVVATIIIAKPFNVMRRPILRDIAFYLIAIGWICFILYYDTQVYIWQPAFLLVLYAIYVCTVIFGRQISQSSKKKERQVRKMERALTLIESKLTILDKIGELKAEELHAIEQKASAMNSTLSIPYGNNTRLSIPNGNTRLSIPNGNMRLSIPNGTSNTNILRIPTVEHTMPNDRAGKPLHPDEICYYVDMDQNHKEHNKQKISLIRSKSDIIADRIKNNKSSNKVGCVTTVPSRRDTQISIHTPSTSALYGPLRVQLAANMMLPSMITKDGEEEYEEQKPIIQHGKFFVVVDEEEDDKESDDSSLVYVRGHHDIISVQEARSRGATIVSHPPPSKDVTMHGIITDLLQHLNPLDMDELKGSNWFMKIYIIIKIPLYFIFNLTIPVAECSWCKSLALIHCFTSPLTILFAFMFLNTAVISGGPGLWAFSLVLSIILAALICFFTTFTEEPRFYKPISAYVGFVLSVAWIYVIANEVVDVVSMIGVMAGVSHELLGLTILAWANSIGDMVADFSVARQGFPRMAISAAIGGPLFNLMIGFGVSFLIAKAQGKTVTTRIQGHHGVDTVKKLMMLFLSASLIITTILLFVQRFNVKRFHAIVLIVLYISFLVMVVLAQTKVLSF